MTTFVLRLQPREQPFDANGVGPRAVVLRGVVEEVSTGHATTFRSASELLDALTWAMAATAPPEVPS